MINICVLGASNIWTPRIVTDLMYVFNEPLELRLIDINPENARMSKEWCDFAAIHHGRKDRVVITPDRRAAIAGADVVIITLSTGGLDAMDNDISIPEQYEIYGTVGDTCGAGGWSRSIRNMSVFSEFARDFSEICPQAFIVNYTNPMSSLTAALQLQCPNPVVGLCHSYFETKDVIQNIFDLKDWSEISISIAGMNHFTWVVDFKIGKEDGYKLLRKKIGNGSLKDVMPKQHSDEIGYVSKHRLCCELYDAYGYLPYPGDRHISEFVSFAISGKQPRKKVINESYNLPLEVFDYCGIRRTPIEIRRAGVVIRTNLMLAMKEGKEKILDKSRETAAEMIHAYLYNKPFTDAVNVLNVGQVPGLPPGCCVETLGVVDGLGVRPVMVPNVPEHLLDVMHPQAICQKWITDGMIKEDKEMLLWGLYRDPQCSHLKPHEVRAMAKELIDANKPFLSGWLTN